MSDNLLRLTKLEMSNFRCFRKMDKPMEFDPNLTVIVAKNGCGKTAVLDAIRISLGTFTKGTNLRSQAGISKFDASLSSLRISQGRGAFYPVAIRVDGFVDSKVEVWRRVRESAEGRTTTKEAQPIANFGARLRDAVSAEGDALPELPILAFYGTGRLWNADTDGVKEQMLQKGLAFESRFSGYEDALTTNSIYAQVKQWMGDAWLCRSNPVEQETAVGKQTSRQYSAVEQATNEILKGTGYRSPHFNTYFKEVALLSDRMGNDEAIAVPISWTSDGIKAAFSLVADIAYRCARLNPAFGEDACRKTQGVVMIDEVDLFLHPAWQQRILPDLRRIFPKIQFVVTTHSPQVVSSVPPECIRIIAEDGQIEGVPTWTEGVESSRILDDVFGTKPYPVENEWRRKLNQYIKDVYAGKWNDPAVRHVGDELSAKFAGMDADFDTARLHVENEEWERDHASN